MIELKDPAFDLTKGEYIAIQFTAALISKYTLNIPADQDLVSKVATELTQTFAEVYNKQFGTQQATIRKLGE